MCDWERARREARLDGVQLAARELAHLVNNELALAVTTLDLLLRGPDLAPDVREQVQEVVASLEAAVGCVTRFQHVVRVETRLTPVGPALDLARSTELPLG